MYMYLYSLVKKGCALCLCLLLFIVYVYFDRQWNHTIPKEPFDMQNYEYEQSYTPTGSSQEITVSTGVDYTTIYNNLTSPSTSYVNNNSAFTYNYIKSNIPADDAAIDAAYFNNATSIMTGYTNQPSVS